MLRLEKGKEYFLPREGRQAHFVRWDPSGLAVFVDRYGEQYHVRQEDVQELPPQVEADEIEEVS